MSLWREIAGRFRRFARTIWGTLRPERKPAARDLPALQKQRAAQPIEPPSTTGVRTRVVHAAPIEVRKTEIVVKRHNPLPPVRPESVESAAPPAPSVPPPVRVASPPPPPTTTSDAIDERWEVEVDRNRTAVSVQRDRKRRAEDNKTRVVTRSAPEARASEPAVAPRRVSLEAHSPMAPVSEQPASLGDSVSAVRSHHEPASVAPKIAPRTEAPSAEERSPAPPPAWTHQINHQRAAVGLLSSRKLRARLHATRALDVLTMQLPQSREPTTGQPTHADAAATQSQWRATALLLRASVSFLELRKNRERSFAPNLTHRYTPPPVSQAVHQTPGIWDEPASRSMRWACRATEQARVRRLKERALTDRHAQTGDAWNVACRTAQVVSKSEQAAMALQENPVANTDADRLDRDAVAGFPTRRIVPEKIPSDYAPAPESTHPIYTVKLFDFEGPFDLLLFLIKKHEIDVFDIPVAFICERYMECLEMMEELQIDVAAEFMSMAAELIHLKSKMLLPRPDDVDDDEDGEDPRAELVRRLLEYQKYKDVADKMHALAWFGRDVTGRQPEVPDEVPTRDGPLKEVGVYRLGQAFADVIKRQKPEFRHQVVMEHANIRQRMVQLIDELLREEKLSFDALLPGSPEKLDIVATFLAMLEMAKMRLVRFFETEEGQLLISARYQEASEAMSRFESTEELTYA